MKTKTTKIILGILIVGALLISVNAFFYKSYLISGLGLISSVVLLFFVFRSKEPEVKLSFPKVVEMYKEYMENGFRITIPQDVLVYYIEEIEDKYISVLCSYDRNEAKMIYYPFEANKFTGEFGRGTGQFFENTIDTEFWINKYDKTYRTGKEIASVMGNTIVKKIREELEFRNRKPEEQGEESEE